MRPYAVRLVHFLGLMASLALTAGAQPKFPTLPDLTFAPNAGGRNVYTGDRWSYMAAGSQDKPAVVMLHGIGGNSMDWRFQLAGLSGQFHAVAWNAPGYMLSDGFKNAESPGCKEFADALADFLDALKLTRVNLLGNSNGSRVAQCFAMHHPSRLIKLAMVGPSAGRKDIPAAERADILAARTKMIGAGPYAFGARADALLGPNATPELLNVVRNGNRATNPRGFMHGAHLLVAEGYSPAEVAAVLKAPLLIIAGDADRVSPIPNNAALLKRAIPAARMETLPGIGHLPHLEAPDAVNRLVIDFFSR